jgi:hypothetical protein
MEKYFILSHPKSGRTWMQLLIGSMFASVNSRFPVDFFIQQVVNRNSACLRPERNYLPTAIIETQKINTSSKNSLPIVVFTHGGTGGIKLDINLKKFQSKKVIILIRDPRDMVVSFYFHMNLRLNIYHDNMSKFIRDKSFGVKRIIDVLNLWSKIFDIAEKAMVIKYEDMNKKLYYELKKISRFMDININKKNIHQTIKFCRFDKMREMEIDNVFNHITLKPGNKNNEESYKTRKGLICGYKNYLTSNDVNYLNNQIFNYLDSRYFYYIHY